MHVKSVQRNFQIPNVDLQPSSDVGMPLSFDVDTSTPNILLDTFAQSFLLVTSILSTSYIKRRKCNNTIPSIVLLCSKLTLFVFAVHAAQTSFVAAKKSGARMANEAKQNGVRESGRQLSVRKLERSTNQARISMRNYRTTSATRCIEHRNRPWQRTNRVIGRRKKRVRKLVIEARYRAAAYTHKNNSDYQTVLNVVSV